MLDSVKIILSQILGTFQRHGKIDYDGCAYTIINKFRRTLITAFQQQDAKSYEAGKQDAYREVGKWLATHTYLGNTGYILEDAINLISVLVDGKSPDNK